MAEEAGRGVKLNRRSIYLMLTNVPSTDSSSIMTALEEAIQITDQTCQPYSVITCN